MDYKIQHLFAPFRATSRLTTLILGLGLPGAMFLPAEVAHAQSTVSKAQKGLQLGFDGKGIASLSYDGIELYGKDSTKTIVQLVNADGSMSGASDKVLGKSFDLATKTQTTQYPWGQVSYGYNQVGSKLKVTVKITNKTEKTIGYAYVSPFSFKVSGGFSDPGKQGSINNIDDFGVSRRDFGGPGAGKGGSIFALTDDANPNISFQGFSFITAPKSTSDYIHADTADIGAGQSQTYHFSLLFEPQSRTYEEVMTALYANRAEQVSPLLKWSDRRPIGSIFAASSDAGYPNNPRGWLNDDRIDINSPAGRANFRERMLKLADSSVANLKKVGAQGMIFWDVEGEEMPHAITYLGEPRILPQAAPEMNEIADQFFAKFRKAGLKTGVTLRPSRVVLDPDSGKWRHNHMAFDPVSEISEKIDYAQNRWGCTLFYVDSNVTYAYGANGKVTTWTMRAEMFRELERRHPDCLIIPEHETFDYWSATAPYQELRSNSFGTSANARLAWPGAFSVINVADGDLARHHDALVEDIENGDVLLFRCWFNDGTLDTVKTLYEEAAPVAPAPEPEPVFEKEIIVDNRDASAFYEGEWKLSAVTKGFYDKNYLQDLDADKGSKSVRFRPSLPRTGIWEVFARWSSYYNRATNAPYDVIDARGQTTTLLNQRLRGGEWVSLGQHAFEAGSSGNVLLRNDGTNGYVIADAIKWVWVGDNASSTTSSSAAPSAASS